MVEAVRKVILSGIYFDGVLKPGRPSDPFKNFILGKFAGKIEGSMQPPPVIMDSTEEIGLKMRAIIDAISMLETGFRELDKLKKVVPLKEVKKNKGR